MSPTYLAVETGGQIMQHAGTRCFR